MLATYYNYFKVIKHQLKQVWFVYLKIHYGVACLLLVGWLAWCCMFLLVKYPSVILITVEDTPTIISITGELSFDVSSLPCLHIIMWPSKKRECMIEILSFLHQKYLSSASYIVSMPFEWGRQTSEIQQNVFLIL